MLAPGRSRAARMARLRIVPGAEHAHGRQLAASAAYAPAFLAAVAPRPFSPPPAPPTGALVRDVFPGVRGRAALEAAAEQAGLTARTQSADEALQAMAQELTRMASAAGKAAAAAAPALAAPRAPRRLA